MYRVPFNPGFEGVKRKSEYLQGFGYYTGWVLSRKENVTEMAGSTKLLDQVRDQMRMLHYAIRIEEAYLKWITEFPRFH